MKSKLLFLIAILGLSASLLAQSNEESPADVTLTVTLVSAVCGDFCYYDFKDITTATDINLTWNEEWDAQLGSIYPGLDNESIEIIRSFQLCAINDQPSCNKVLNKTFVVKASKKTREETIATGPESWEKTGKIEVYYEIKNIRIK
jgi:hypothetical protein